MGTPHFVDSCACMMYDVCARTACVVTGGVTGHVRVHDSGTYVGMCMRVAFEEVYTNAVLRSVKGLSSTVSECGVF